MIAKGHEMLMYLEFKKIVILFFGIGSNPYWGISLDIPRYSDEASSAIRFEIFCLLWQI
jgi:hypothetical protein